MCLLKVALLAVGAGGVVSAGVRSKRSGFFMEVLRARQRFMELDWNSVDNL